MKHKPENRPKEKLDSSFPSNSHMMNKSQEQRWKTSYQNSYQPFEYVTEASDKSNTFLRTQKKKPSDIYNFRTEYTVRFSPQGK